MRNRRHNLNLMIVMLCLFFSFKSQAQNTMLWEIKHSEKDTKSYLLGTFHQMGNSFVDSIPKIKELLYSSELAFFESVDSIDRLRTMLNNRENHFEYREELRKRDVNFLEDYSEDWSVPIRKLTPIELYIKLSQAYLLNTCGTAKPTDEWDHFDKFLIYLAKKKNISIQGLETDSLQTEDINKMALDYDWKKASRDIKNIVRNIRKSKTRTPPCEDARKYMNFEFNYHFDEACGDSNIIERNNKWMPILLDSLNSKSVFIAVGLLHLYGKCGLIEQLRQKGFIVNPIEIERANPITSSANALNNQ